MEKIIINNAGLSMIAPFLFRLFKITGYLDEGGRLFKDDDSKIRAIFLIQYLAYGEQREFPETDLYFNKVLVNWTADKPLPRTCNLSENEIKTANELFSSVKNLWEIISRISDQGVRESFIQRKAVMSFENPNWVVQVEERAYDILIDRIPWGFKMVRFPWMGDYIINIKWRN